MKLKIESSTERVNILILLIEALKSIGRIAQSNENPKLINGSTRRMRNLNCGLHSALAGCLFVWFSILIWNI